MVRVYSWIASLYRCLEPDLPSGAKRLATAQYLT